MEAIHHKIYVLANLFGKVWTTLLAIVFVPYYVEALGIEAYGLVGIYTFISTVLYFFDFGIGTTLNRELAKSSVTPELVDTQRNFIRSTELVSWSITVIISAVLFLSSSYVSTHWLHPEKTLSHEEVCDCLLWMSLALSSQLPIILYQEGLSALHKQVLSNTVLGIVFTLRAFGALYILMNVSATAEAFFIWQTVVNLIHSAAFRFCLYRSTPKSRQKFRFDTTLLKRIGKFASGFAITSFFWMILMQMDKIMLSSMLPLKQFGFYSLASMAANGILLIVAAIYTAYFPTFSKMIALNDTEGLIQTYHTGCQTISILAIPLAVLLIFFAPEAMYIWTGSEEIIKNTWLVVSILSIGSLFCGLIFLPHGIQFAYGKIELVLLQTVISALILIPLLYFAVKAFGVIGGSLAWTVVNLGFVLIEVPLMHRTIFPKEKWKWYIQDTGLPLLGAVGVTALLRYVFPEHPDRVSTFIFVLLVFSTSMFVTAALTPLGREQLAKFIFRRGSVAA